MSSCCGAREQEGAAAEARFKHKLPGFSSLSPDKHNNFVSGQAPRLSSKACPHTLHCFLGQALCRSKYSSFVTMAIRNEKTPNGSISTSSSTRGRQVKRRGFFSRLVSIALRYALALAACLTRRLLTLPQIVYMVLAPDSRLPLPVIAQTTYQ